jgi:hypothetical protein
MEHLSHVEGVATGDPVQLFGVEAAVDGHGPYRFGRERRQFDTTGRALHRKLPERHPQGVAPREFVLPVGRHDQHRHLADPAG